MSACCSGCTASHHGVFLFFVLSGFLIGRMWWLRPPKRRSSSMTYAAFAWRRTLRIYPAFLLAFAASLGFAYHSGTWTPPDVARVVGNLVFLNGAPGSHVVPFNLVTWSLFYEMTFYFAFPLLAVLATGARARVAVAMCRHRAAGGRGAAGADILVLCWSLLFFGVALAAAEGSCARRSHGCRASRSSLAYLLVTTAAMLDRLPAVAGIVAFGVVALLVIAQEPGPRQRHPRWLALRPLRELGRVSYSFYLVHWMVVVLVARALEPT